MAKTTIKKKKTRKGGISQNDKKHIIPVLVKLFKQAKGKSKAVNCSWIMRTIYSKVGVRVASATVRELIHEIRVKGLVKCLVASGMGYHVSSSTAEMLQYDKALLHRIKEIGSIRRALKKQAAEILGKQKKAKLKRKK